MSINKVVKLLKNIRKFADEYSDEQNPFYRKRTSELGEEIRNRLLDGLVGGYDINGHRFKGLKKSTMAIRKKIKGVIHSRPLRMDGGIVDFVKSSDFIQTGTLQVKLKSLDSGGYMEAQNKGFQVADNSFSKRLNTRGKYVPPRTWYGIPKTYREGGTKYKKFINKVARALDIEFGKAIKKG